MAKLKKRKNVPGEKTISFRGVLQQASALQQAGRFQEAEGLYRKILFSDPDHPHALHSLGMLAHQVGKSETAVELIKKAILCKPDYVEAYYNLGIVLLDQGKNEEAIVSYSQAVSLRPEYVEAHNNLGNAFLAEGKLDQAVASFSRALALKPDFVDAHNNLGVALLEQGNFNKAEVSYRQALALKPDYAEAHYSLGLTLHAQGMLEKAITSFRMALCYKPDFADAYLFLGDTLRLKGAVFEAIDNLRHALILKPDAVEALNLLGIILQEQGRITEAIAIYEQVLMIDPGYAEVHSHMGAALLAQGRVDEAVACQNRAIAIKPDKMMILSNLLMCLNYLPCISQREIFEKSLEGCNQIAKTFPMACDTYQNEISLHRKLRIGYLSADLKEHSVACFLEPVLRAHDKENLEVYCYANVESADERTKRLQDVSDHWSFISGKSDLEIVELIRKDRIDILVDLGGHTGKNKLPVFACKPSPIQVSWLGYPNTTGLRTIDYRFTDAVADSPGESDKFHSEKLFRLEHGFLCYGPDDSAPDVAPPPCVDRDYVTFGSFNNIAKITSEVIEVWAALLGNLPSARLLLKSKPLADSETRERYLRVFAENGIVADRLDLLGWLPAKGDHLKLYHRIDIGLDPFPYNGTTTTCESLWMGVPVVTLFGDRHAARVGASILHHAGLDDLIAYTKEGYVAKAMELARNQECLRKLRHTLRPRMKESRLMNSKLITGSIESAYRLMWENWCAEQVSISSRE